MILAVYSLLAWVTIIVLVLIPKYLTRLENIIVFIIISMIYLDLYSRLTLVHLLFKYSEAPDKFYSFCIYRSLILPLGILIFLNCLGPALRRFMKIASSVLVLLFLCLMEYLNVRTGIITYTGWTVYLEFLLLIILMACTAVSGKLLRRIG